MICTRDLITLRRSVCRLYPNRFLWVKSYLGRFYTLEGQFVRYFSNRFFVLDVITSLRLVVTTSTRTVGGEGMKPLYQQLVRGAGPKYFSVPHARRTCCLRSVFVRGRGGESPRLQLCRELPRRGLVNWCRDCLCLKPQVLEILIWVPLYVGYYLSGILCKNRGFKHGSACIVICMSLALRYSSSRGLYSCCGLLYDIS